MSIAAPAASVLDIPACPERLAEDDVARFHRDGFLAYDGFLNEREVGNLRQALTGILSELRAEALQGGVEVSAGNWDGMRNYSGMRIRRANAKDGYVLLEPGAALDVKSAPLDAWEDAVRKFASPTELHADFARLSVHSNLRGMVEALLGPSPILYGDMALCKPPRIGVAKPWHQDGAYFHYLPHDAGVDVWIALDDAAVENGCMFVLPGGHLLGPKKHVHRDDCTIADGRLDYSRAVPVELKAGGILLFHVLLPHYTPPNTSALRRRAVQYFFRAGYTRLVDAEAKRATFLEADGTPASCAAAQG